MKYMVLFSAYLLATLWAVPTFGATINVPGDQPTMAAAIAAANPTGDIISLGAGTYTESILADGWGSVTEITIQGQGEADTTVNGAFNVPAGLTVTLEDMSIDGGGTISQIVWVNAGTLTCNNVTSASSASNSFRANGGATLVLNDCIGVSAVGHGLANQGATVTATTLSIVSPGVNGIQITNAANVDYSTTIDTLSVSSLTASANAGDVLGNAINVDNLPTNHIVTINGGSLGPLTNTIPDGGHTNQGAGVRMWCADGDKGNVVNLNGVTIDQMGIALTGNNCTVNMDGGAIQNCKGPWSTLAHGGAKFHFSGDGSLFGTPAALQSVGGGNLFTTTGTWSFDRGFGVGGQTDLTFDGATFTGEAGISLLSGGWNTNSDVILNDCTIAGVTNGGAFLNNGADVETSSIIVNNPSITGRAATILASCTGALGSIEINGASASSKLSLNNAISAGTILIGRVQAGRLKLANVTASLVPDAGFIDSYNVLSGNAVIEFENCAFYDGSGGYHANVQEVCNFGITFNAINTIWEGDANPPNYPDILSINGNHTVPSAMNLTHCTLYFAESNNVLIDADVAFDNTQTSPARGDVVTARYCVFDASNGAAATGTFALAGQGNVVQSGSAGGFLPGQPADTLVGNPLLDAATGRISADANSLALGAALGSTQATDFEGNTRPLGGGVPDAGAHESAVFGVNDTLTPDSDNDGMPDAWETANGFDPYGATGVNGANADPDGDGWTNFEEYQRNTDPNRPDPRPVPVGGIALVGMAVALAVAGIAARKRL